MEDCTEYSVVGYVGRIVGEGLWGNGGLIYDGRGDVVFLHYALMYSVL